MLHEWAVYLDLDGVFADYDAGIRRLGFEPDPAKKNELNRSGSNDPFKRPCTRRSRAPTSTPACR
jgi:hypothetical protein